MYVVAKDAKYAKITISGSEVVKFPATYNVFGVKGDGITAKLSDKNETDGVYDTDDGNGHIVISHYANLDTLYLYGNGDVIVWAGNSPIDNPLPDSVGGSGGSSVTVIGLNVTQNGEYTAPSGTAYSPVTVTVPPSGVEIIDESDWDNMTTAQKQAKGVVAIRQFVTGYDRGVLVNGADYPPMPVIMSAQSRNGGSTGYLQYSIPQGGRYQIIGVRKPNSFLEDIVISVNDVAQTTRYIRSTDTPIGLEVYVIDTKVNTGDTIKVSNTIAQSDSGVHMFVMKNVEAENLAIYYALGNGNPQGFLIDTTLPYLQVSRFGYYNGANVFEFYEIDHVVKQSEPVGSDNKYWYGGSYVLTLQGSLS